MEASATSTMWQLNFRSQSFGPPLRGCYKRAPHRVTDPPALSARQARPEPGPRPVRRGPRGCRPAAPNTVSRGWRAEPAGRARLDADVEHERVEQRHVVLGAAQVHLVRGQEQALAQRGQEAGRLARGQVGVHLRAQRRRQQRLRARPEARRHRDLRQQVHLWQRLGLGSFTRGLGRGPGHGPEAARAVRPAQHAALARPAFGWRGPRARAWPHGSVCRVPHCRM